MSSFANRTVGEVEKLGGGEVGIVAIIRKGEGRQIPTRRWKLCCGSAVRPSG
jgi:hypothetical protein